MNGVRGHVFAAFRSRRVARACAPCLGLFIREVWILNLKFAVVRSAARQGGNRLKKSRTTAPPQKTKAGWRSQKHTKKLQYTAPDMKKNRRLTRFCRSHRSPSGRRTKGASPHHTMTCTDVGGRATDCAGSSVAVDALSQGRGKR